MRSRSSLFPLLLIAGSLAAPHLAHAAIPFFGPIIPDAYKDCAGGWGLLVQVINNIIELLLTLAIVFVAPLMIAYAGFLFVANPFNPSGKEKAKGILLHTVAGIVVALSAWLIVDAIMAVLYNPNASSGTTSLTVWTDLVTGNGARVCIPLAGSLVQAAPPSPGIVVGAPPTGALISTVGPGGQAVTVTFAPTQSAASLQAGFAAASAYSALIANACTGSSIPSCTTVITALIAAESAGNPATPCNSKNACGIMQLTQANGGMSCAPTDTACISTQITKGVQLFQQGYNRFPNTPNALAAYNSGITTQAGQSANGLNSAMVASVNCPGYYAWQCSINPGGLVETQNYVANICQNIVSHGGTCN